MKNLPYSFYFIFLFHLTLIHSQEWKNIKTYKKETGNTILIEGSWLKKDRKNQTKTWQNANQFNLQEQTSNLKYKTISEKRDFYLWFDQVRKKQGHEVKWIGIATIAANQLSHVENNFIKIFIVRNKEVVQFSQNGSEAVFAYAFPEMKKVYNKTSPLKGVEAQIWDNKYGLIEQCEILEPLYQKLSQKALHKLERMAKGKGVFKFGVHKKLQFIGEIDNCNTRFKHGINILLPYYLDRD